MQTRRPRALAAVTLCAALCAVLPTGAAAQSSSAWTTSASLYLWFPSLDGKSIYPPDGGGSSVGVDVSTLLENLEGVFMGTLEAHNGRWGVYSDLIYLDIGAHKSGGRTLVIGGAELPAGVSADTRMDLVGGAWTLGGSWRVLSAPAPGARHAHAGTYVDLVGGARYLDIETRLRWTLGGNLGPIALPDRSGDRSTRLQNWDAFVGAKGRVGLGDAAGWFVPWYFDAGAGESKLTLQAMAGVGYAFSWGETVLAWRYVDYKFKPGRVMEELSFNGGLVAATFRW